MFERKAYYDLVRETMKEVKTERISPDEWKKFRDLRMEALGKEPDALSPFVFNNRSETEWNNADWKNWMELLGREENRFGCFIAKDRDRFIGMLGYGDQGRQSKSAFLWGMYVNKDYRGQDIGEKLIKATLENLKSDSRYDKVELTVMASNIEVMNFYERFGFRISEAKQIEGPNGEISEVYVMEKELRDQKKSEEEN